MNPVDVSPVTEFFRIVRSNLLLSCQIASAASGCGAVNQSGMSSAGPTTGISCPSSNGAVLSVDRGRCFEKTTAAAMLNERLSEMLDEPIVGPDPLARHRGRRLNDFNAEIFDPPELRKRFVARFPDSVENFFRHFDDKLIYWGQLFRNKPLYIWNLLINAILSIELGIALPLCLFAAGEDAVGTIFTYVMLIAALVSQIPKRFVWRFRPFMQNRAFLLRPDMTSSFPSRAVTCAIVYTYLICYAVIFRSGAPEVQGWMPIFICVLIVLSSYARIQYGCHFPSDCVFAILQGLFICTIGTALYMADVYACASCAYNRCYAQSLDLAVNWQRVASANWALFAAVTVVGGAAAVFSIAPPLRFWGKCHHVYGMLLPCIAFQLTYLCPLRNGLFALAQPPHVPPWWAPLVGVVLAVIGTVLGMKVKGRFALLAYAGLFVLNFFILMFVRLSFYDPGLYYYMLHPLQS